MYLIQRNFTFNHSKGQSALLPNYLPAFAYQSIILKLRLLRHKMVQSLHPGRHRQWAGTQVPVFHLPKKRYTTQTADPWHWTDPIGGFFSLWRRFLFILSSSQFFHPARFFPAGQAGFSIVNVKQVPLARTHHKSAQADKCGWGSHNCI